MSERVSVAIIGGGPAGLTAAIYLGRAGVETKVYDPAVPGGMVFMVHQIENYPGFPDGISGRELAAKMEAQAKRFGAEIVQVGVKKVYREDKEFKLDLTDNQELMARAVVIATGSNPRPLGIPGEQELLGRGVSYCATCDGNFFRNEDVAVIGGGDSAVQEALYLSQICKKVYLVHRRDQLRAKKILEQRAADRENLRFQLNSLPQEIIGKDQVEGLKIMDKDRGKEQILKVTGVFIYVGMKPETDPVKGLVELNPDGFIKALENTRTSVPGIFAVGDVREKPTRQVASAVADGCNAALAIEEYFLEYR